MWQKLSIRFQLSVLTSFLILSVLAATVALSTWLDYKQRQTLAIELADTLNKSMQHDILKVFVSNTADEISSLSFKLSIYKSLKQAYVEDANGKGVYEYKKSSVEGFTDLIQNANEMAQFEQDELFVKHPIKVDGYQFGSVTYVIDMKTLTTQLNAQIQIFFMALPVLLIFGFVLASRMSQRYTQPFEALTKAMKTSDPANNQFQKLETDSENEIKQLYQGYDTLMTQIAETTSEMRYQSQHDQLTGLFNRFYIEDKISDTLNNDDHALNALISIDLDQFKLINDAAGFHAGDELLKMIANGCETKLSDNAIMARVGGDDFLILLSNTTEQDAISFAKQRLNALKDFRFVWEGQAYSVSASMGMAYFRPHEYTLEEIMKAAQSAFYYAKQSGRNKLAIYQKEDATNNNYNKELITAGFIKEALSDGPSRFELFAQAIVPLQQDSDKFGYEILIRMWDADNNFVPPDNFLPTAERYQLMTDIDCHVLWNFLEMVTKSPEHIENLHVAHVNLAGSSLNHPDFQAKVKEAVAHFDFPWHKLELELTETSAVGNFNQAKHFIEWLKAHKIGLALDDFGTGMSSFEYLKSLPFDVVKIDGSFVKDMHTDPTDKAVIRYIQEIAMLKNQETIAEYVETEQDVEELRKIGITNGQGYHLGKPKPLKEWL